ncbi:helix-turn-helix domain-containing protein [Streptomyces sp. BPTC-684]|uniref:helix-turn-helix domain-containing protein n=1 Tax=Streptomyces sp. BPTC-684 TaxID=3043734 RepID=UPI0024B07493|nr:helix-turn-helix domain-containing protein [Streptomyces sp. BPTC-684]WHM37970.1 helix-turn-helix domain-containing protein [Streptomyces sp. BPTC-684]
MLEQPEFGQLLKTLRQERGLSQAEVAQGGMSTAYLSRLESGSRRPTAMVLDHLTRRLGVPVSVFQGIHTSLLGQALASASSSDDTDDAIRMLGEAVQADSGEDLSLRWLSLWKLAQLHAKRGERQHELAAARELTELSDRLEVSTLQVRSRTLLARCLRAVGDIDEARDVVQNVLRTAGSGAVPVADTLRTQLVLVSLKAESGLITEARRLADQLLEPIDVLPPVLRAEALWSAANVRIRQGDYPGAAQMLQRALTEVPSHDDLMLRLRLAASSLYLQMIPRRVTEAQQWLTEAERALSLFGGPLHRQELLVIKAHLAFQQRDLVQAKRLCEQLTDALPQLTFRDRIRLEVLAQQIRILEGYREVGVRRIEELAQEAQSASNVHLASEIWRTLAETLAWASERQAAPSLRQPSNFHEGVTR